MSRLSAAAVDEFSALIDACNRCFYNRDIAALKRLYVADGDVRYFESHAGCDSLTLTDHLGKVEACFRSGAVEPLPVQDLAAHQAGDGACVSLVLRYRSRPRPGVRTALYLDRERGAWRTRHAHHSFDPNQAEPTT